uniref:Uncharacterized protein n=1 Tax=Setaria italica TaxID=4555 RepID=K3ZFW5_SETIT
MLYAIMHIGFTYRSTHPKHDCVGIAKTDNMFLNIHTAQISTANMYRN